MAFWHIQNVYFVWKGGRRGWEKGALNSSSPGRPPPRHQSDSLNPPVMYACIKHRCQSVISVNDYSS